MSFTYILYSSTIDKYYIGATQTSLEERLENHNSHAYGMSHFTAQADDWILVLSFKAKDYSHAIRLERKIKSMKLLMELIGFPKFSRIRFSKANLALESYLFLLLASMFLVIVS